MQIIINKTDEIEDLKEKLENLSKNLKEALKKQIIKCNTRIIVC